MTTALGVIVPRQTMNNPSNHLTNLGRSKRNLSRLGLLVLAVLMTLGALVSSAGATPTVETVLPPTPSGTEPGGEIFLQATVTGSGSAAMTFYLGETPSHNGNDVAIGSTTAAPGTVGVAGLVPQGVAPGFYYLQACIGSDCVASAGTIHIIGQALGAVDQSTETSVLAEAPGPEYFPETTLGMAVGSPFPCPISAHGQYPSNCVWVTTQVQKIPTKTGVALWYCPTTNPYPYVVALGFDPLWEDRSFGFFLTTRPVSFTKYKTDFFGPFSYAGGSGNRGYALFSWTSRERAHGAKVQVGYVCSDRLSVSAYP